MPILGSAYSIRMTIDRRKNQCCPLEIARMVGVRHVSENAPEVTQCSSDPGVEVNARNLIYFAIARKGLPELRTTKNTLKNSCL